MTAPPRWPAPARGFTLLELLLAMSLGMLLFGVMLQLLLGDLRLGAAMAARLQARSQQRRSLALIGAELASAAGWQADPEPSERWPCSLAGRRAVLAIATDPADPQARGDAAIVYSIGRAPSPIWRGDVLMRCGPAYTLEGDANLSGAFQNRVLLDRLPQDGDAAGLIARPQPDLPVLDVTLEQDLSPHGQLSTTAAL
jgi:prepilin-type N-terminal cleavage/methylation domain-containing protein